ncbi:MAG: hypothetical protein HGGPFJEG_01177 [Ignavibacteria bacterium]|nr:hypothetical protein [Ignavibacteria bacterium]
MKNFLLLFLTSLLISNNSFSQIPANKNWDGTKPEIYENSKAFVFFYSPFVSSNLGSAFAGNLSLIPDTSITPSTITNFQILNLFGIGVKYFVSPKIDLNLAFNLGNVTLEEQRSSQSSSTPVNKFNVFTFGVSFDGNYRLRSLYNISPYIGANVNYSVLNSEIKTISGSTFSDEISGNTFGFGANFGFDWYFIPGMSLGGKYTFGWLGSGGLEEIITGSSSPRTIKYPKMNSFGTGIMSILLNVHF